MAKPPANANETGSGWLVVNVLIIIILVTAVGLLWRTQQEQEHRIAELESISGRPLESDRPTVRGRASQQDRVTLLLASAGNADDSKRLLDAASVPECVEIARALIARPAASDRNAALTAACVRIAGSEPATAVGLLDQVSEPTLRSELALRVTNRWMEQSPDAVVRWLVESGRSKLTADALNAQFARAVERWSAYDPENAVKFLAAVPATTMPALPQASANASMEWGRKNPQVALTWAQALPASDPRRLTMTEGVLTGWSEREPAATAAYLQERYYGTGSGNETPAQFAAVVADRWAHSDPSAAAQWASGLPNRRAKRGALAAVASVWADTDLPAAASWAAALGDGDGARQAAWEVIVKAWPIEDLDGEGNWVSGLPTGADRDYAIALHAAKWMPTDPEKALTWGKTIANPEERLRSVQGILQSWEGRDLVAARNWAAANGVVLPAVSRQ